MRDTSTKIQSERYEGQTHPTETWASSANVTDNLGLLADLGDVRRAGGDGNGEVDDDDDATDACFVVCWTSLTDASTSEANVSSTSELGNGRLPHDCCVRCKRHRKEPACVVGAHKHELAFPDTDDVDDDDDEVDTTEDMALLIRVFKCSHRSANTKTKRNETKWPNPRNRYKLIPLLMQLPTSHENSICRGDSGPNARKTGSVDSWIRDPATGERIKGGEDGMRERRGEGRRGASKRVVCRLRAPLWGRERRPGNGWGAARPVLPGPARCPWVPFSPHGATLKVITVASLILVILKVPSLSRPHWVSYVCSVLHYKIAWATLNAKVQNDQNKFVTFWAHS